MSKKTSGDNDSKNNCWNEWASKKNDWNMSSGKRPKLEIQKNHLSQSSAKPTVNVQAGPSFAGRGGSFKRTNSLPISSSKPSPTKDVNEEFVDTVQEEFEAEELRRLAEAAAAIEFEIAQSQILPKVATTPQNVKPLKDKFGNNGSSGFECLFQEELAADYVEECMLLASQEIQASQNVSASTETSAYSMFFKGLRDEAHSSILETEHVEKKPGIPSKGFKQTSTAPGDSVMKPPTHTVSSRSSFTFPKPLSRPIQPSVQPRNKNSILPSRPAEINPQAEAEVRRLTKLQDEYTNENKKLKDSLRTKEGEASILRSQLRQAVIDREHHAQLSARRADASERQYSEKLKEMSKELEATKLKLEFQEAEANAAKERYKLLSRNALGSPLHKNTGGPILVEPQSQGTSAIPSVQPGPPRTPSRHKHVSSFLNRSTFEEPCSTSRLPVKRARLSENEEQGSIDVTVPDPIPRILKPETRSVGEQTTLHVCDTVGAQGHSSMTLSEALSHKLAGVQLISNQLSTTELWKNEDTCFDKKERIPTLSLMKGGSKSRQCCEADRPSLLNCARSLRNLMSWNDPVTDCPPTEASMLQIAEECCGILHYNLILLQDKGRPSNKELRDRDQDIFSRGLEILSLMSYDLLDEKYLYKEENGIEMRRCLGILSEIALVSPFTASLVIGALDPSKAVIKRHKFTQLPDYAFVKQQCAVEDGDRFYFLKVLCGLCNIFVEQKLTIAYNGVLAGILTLLRNCARHNVIEESSEKDFLKIIHLILIARPSSFVLCLLVDLLTSVSNCQTIMRGLCTKCDETDCIVESSSGLCTFTRDSCPLQVICIQLLAVTEKNRWMLIERVAQWLVAVVAQGVGAPSWIFSSPNVNNQSHVACCIRLTKMLIFLQSDVVGLLQEILDSEECSPGYSIDWALEKDFELKSTLVQTLRRSIIILLKLVENHMFKYMARVEGLYELLLHRIERFRKHLHLPPCLEKYLEDLLKVEQDTDSQPDAQPADASGPNFYLDGASDIIRSTS